MCGYRDIDSRGERVLEFLLENNLFIENSPDAPPTFERGIFKGWLYNQYPRHNYINPLLEGIRNSQTQDNINKTMNNIQNKIINACKSTYKIKKQEVVSPPSWYTSKLEIGKNRLKALRRRRAQRTPQYQRRHRFLNLKKDQALYMRHFKQVKNSGWRTFCTNVSNALVNNTKPLFEKPFLPSIS
ncbi:hypothetical protein AVEN_14547-1 [Araneus ventricosus]|uniref:Uncharacterized protein n=1 Tax=Araneus ventricosus TaxID=182803 RepID=A0A4Y2CI88_ARAVE|nr:hypothetical protein AVEN_14547-1 [Araneus ventricosus]